MVVRIYDIVYSGSSLQPRDGAEGRTTKLNPRLGTGAEHIQECIKVTQVCRSFAKD